MAKVGEEEVEYESDPEEGKRLLGMRRREAASDDEEGDEAEREEKRRVDRRGPIRSRDELDGQGGVADYDDDNEEEEEEEEEDGVEEDEGVYEDLEEEDGVYEEEENVGGYGEGKVGRDSGAVELKEVGMEGRKVEREEGNYVEEEREEEEYGDEEEGKKENEPFAVPTAGAFYMHDDRFRENAGGRHRRTFVGRRLWESKDDKKWGHDKFEEMTIQERHREQGRTRGSHRTRGSKNRGMEHGYNRRNKSRPFSNGNSQNEAPRGVKGRGPRKYEHMMRNINQAPLMQNKQRAKAPEKASHASSGNVNPPISNTEPDPAPPARKYSSLNYASPPFYPSVSSNKDVSNKDMTMMQKKAGVQLGNTSRNHRTSVVDESLSMKKSNALMRGKSIADSVGLEKLCVDDTAANAKSLNNSQMPPTGSPLVNSTQPALSRSQGRVVATSVPMAYQSITPVNQVPRSSTSVQLQGVRRGHSQSHIQPASQVPRQQLSQRSVGGSQASSPQQTGFSSGSYESRDGEANSDSSKSRTALVAKGKGSIQGSGRGSFCYGGAQVVGATGNIGVGHGDQNFPTFLPVMQLGGQHPGGMGVPAVGMAFPGYVAQTQLGLGSSEMTWLPVLTGAAGALGATYCSPYLAVDGAYQARPSGQPSAVGSSSKDNNVSKPTTDPKYSPRPELVNDDIGQREKPRRYSEMDFKQPGAST